jgi:hypothetical protein
MLACGATRRKTARMTWRHSIPSVAIVAIQAAFLLPPPAPRPSKVSSQRRPDLDLSPGFTKLPGRSGNGRLGRARKRLVGAVPMEQNDDWQAQNRYMQMEGLAEPADKTADLKPLHITPEAA